MLRFPSTSSSIVHSSLIIPSHLSPCTSISLAAVFWSAITSVPDSSIAHPYLLADNRHYPFYLWRKVINAHWSSKYLLIPAYICSWFSIIKILGESQRKIWVVAYFLATAAVLVPAPLIEFRYFTTPFYFLMLHSQMNGRLNWSLVALLYIALNAFTMFMFLFRPFYWENETGKQRFIW
ncbi:dol-P-Glc:Glc(2)Man(9)GlcNAc(2)-PP-Dol alpha-1,2-glucosyltransferase isoform X1 [Cucumis melo var. makuwa]|uniref:Dol-P-Glc:Glc(2)Man(9)GlcNAc(2)-PP-Dol alpha-1,2-glucosyltransferase n=1 Tax=Cucumis melo var. makuwa TaxID=1194695 RepID=A0A5A7SQ31_CUCMM|nr:dol-P-Glc:Glc(2)Man(9)GlcNAc(2)-PP-Dol alpha-1,2-glucosyltransferase isoform X1 [Cucumis melo var. makuwa]TYK23529.1 dol-P-Glc:Glc(2)Man(9)GlcNAc(2)-PP-Dol alpha-1,2-glucosyltransferase isoform X1 [Cucumis melo var. makuwa]